MEEAIDFLKEDMFREKMKWESNKYERHNRNIDIITND
jgi:hypothetical protein